MKYIKKNYNYLLFSFFLFSILFWFLEIGYSLIFRDKFVLPGSWYGPYCPIYGLTFVLLFSIFNHKDGILLNIVKIAITVTSMEYIISYTSEKIFNKLIWNYSNKFLNLNGRICLEMSIIFTITGVIMMYIFVPLTKRIYNKFDYNIKYTNIFLSIVFLLDIIITLINKAHIY